MLEQVADGVLFLAESCQGLWFSAYTLKQLRQNFMLGLNCLWLFETRGFPCQDFVCGSSERKGLCVTCVAEKEINRHVELFDCEGDAVICVFVHMSLV